ncbi:hypothetical protein DPMN_006075 [Dreissena polymorpha]|uniref:Uncharacterized protein n=1 Tax=Dreissena polymorpha TaxID=45954 RepID=A0A9D4MUR2_DREPO|nr:hypothetical protein DPMN_006075 [Dreissena polymorpha]
MSQHWASSAVKTGVISCHRRPIHNWTYSLFGSQWSEQLACAVEQSRWHSERSLGATSDYLLGATSDL